MTIRHTVAYVRAPSSMGRLHAETSWRTFVSVLLVTSGQEKRENQNSDPDEFLCGLSCSCESSDRIDTVNPLGHHRCVEGCPCCLCFKLALCRINAER